MTKKKEDQRSPLLLSRAREAHRRWTLFCISLDSYRPGASIERPNNEPRTDFNVRWRKRNLRSNLNEKLPELYSLGLVEAFHVENELSY